MDHHHPMHIPGPALAPGEAQRRIAVIREALKPWCMDVSPVPIGERPVTCLHLVVLCRDFQQSENVLKRATRHCAPGRHGGKVLSLLMRDGAEIRLHLAFVNQQPEAVYSTFDLKFPG